MVVIRRELPRTSGADPAAMGLSHSGDEDSPLPCAAPAADRLCLYRVHELLAASRPSGSSPYLPLVTLELTADRPDEAEQLPAESGDDLLLVFTLGQQRSITGMQAMLRAPGDGLDRLARAALAGCQRRADVGTMSVAPGRLGHDTPQVRVARLADRAAAHALAAGMLARDDAGVTHQLAGMTKARDLPQLRHQRHRRDLRHPTQALQPGDDLPQLLGHRLHRHIDGPLEAHDARGGMLDLACR